MKRNGSISEAGPVTGPAFFIFVAALGIALLLGMCAVASADHPPPPSPGHSGHAHDAEVPVTAELMNKPREIVAGVPAELTIVLKDPEGRAVTDLTISHERLVHVVIVSEDFRVFAHIHPEDFGPITDEIKRRGQYTVKYAFPQAGRYLVAIDAAYQGKMFSRSLGVTVVGKPGPAALKKDLSGSKRFGEYDVSMKTIPNFPAAGKPVSLIFRITRDGDEVRDLQSYLAAPMHLAIIRYGLNNFIHAHGDVPGQEHAHPIGHIHGATSSFGPDIEASVVFPLPGLYQIFGQVMHNGRVLLLDFMVEVE